MKGRLYLLVTLLGYFWTADAQPLVAQDAPERTSYRLPYAKVGAENALITIANPHARGVAITAVVQDDFGNQIDALSDELGPRETKSFPAASLPPGGARLHVSADARLQLSITYQLDGVTFEMRIVEPERDELTSDSVAETDGDAINDAKHFTARAAVAVTYGSTCGGQTSVGDPYPCGNGGNCTWWAWKMAKDNWGVSLPGMGDANNWATAARNNAYRVSSTPAPQTIGVNTWMAGGLGHVFWVTSVNGNQVCGTEMLWGAYGMRSNCYPTSTFNAGFIYPPSLNVVSPNGWEFWSTGSRRTINWTSTGDPGSYVRIELLQYGTLKSVIATNVPRGQTTGSFSWIVPWYLPAGGYTIRITSASNSRYTDVSDAAFYIM